MHDFQRSVIVFEPRPRWTPELQRQFHGENVRVRQCTRSADLRRLATESSLLILDFDAAPADVLQFLGRYQSRLRRSLTVAIGSRGTSELEWTARDLGALDFRVDAPTGRQLASFCRRQWNPNENEGGRKITLALRERDSYKANGFEAG